MTDTMIKIAMFLGDNGEAELSRELSAEIERLLTAEREKFRGLLDAVPRISTDGDGDTWMHAPNVGINLSAVGGSIIQKNLLAWAEKLKQATEKARALLEELKQ